MKIRTKADVNRLDQKIKSDLGVDCSKYRNDRVVENFVEILIFIEYVFTAVVLPILLAMILYVFGFFVLDLVHVQYFIYGIFGFILFFVSGFFVGLMRLTQKMKNDLTGILDYTFEMMQQAICDVNYFGKQTTTSNKAAHLKLLFKGMIHLVTIPTLTTVIAIKMPIIGFIFSGLIKKILMFVSDRISFKDDGHSVFRDIKDVDEMSFKSYNQSISRVSMGMKNTLHYAFAVVRFPIKVVAFVVIALLLLFILMLH